MLPISTAAPIMPVSPVTPVAPVTFAAPIDSDKTADQKEIEHLAAELHKEQLKAKINEVKNANKICEYCGSKNSRDNHFCINCGAPLSE